MAHTLASAGAVGNGEGLPFYRALSILRARNHSKDKAMHAKTLGIAATALALACGGGDQQQTQQQPQTSGSTPAVSSAVVDVRMTGNSRDKAAFEPAALTIAAGTTVRFTNVSGGPHNVVFWADSIPAGSAEVLNGAITGRQGNLASPYVVQPNGTYEITFPATLPAGVYKGYCAPHLMMGMKIAITIQ
jgi:plastocyanin